MEYSLACSVNSLRWLREFLPMLCYREEGVRDELC
jgi:hypothetical protein